MPDVKDAIKVVTDPANLSSFGDSRRDVRQVNEGKVVAALRELGAEGKADARNLAVQAIGELGGGVETRVEPGGQGAGTRPRVIETWYVPAEAVRDQ
ncbi:MAG: hypothetical protein QOI10_232 [Solirubrobacterales bacterium]|nr:hypothetical protein [Solirubrobacterales bacterium]